MKFNDRSGCERGAMHAGKPLAPNESGAGGIAWSWQVEILIISLRRCYDDVRPKPQPALIENSKTPEGTSS